MTLSKQWLFSIFLTVAHNFSTFRRKELQNLLSKTHLIHTNNFKDLIEKNTKLNGNVPIWLLANDNRFINLN